MTLTPAAADLTEAKRLARYKQSERYQAYQARMQAWQAEQERKRQAAALASFRAQERASVSLPPAIDGALTDFVQFEEAGHALQ